MSFVSHSRTIKHKHAVQKPSVCLLNVITLEYGGVYKWRPWIRKSMFIFTSDQRLCLPLCAFAKYCCMSPFHILIFLQALTALILFILFVIEYILQQKKNLSLRLNKINKIFIRKTDEVIYERLSNLTYVVLSYFAYLTGDGLCLCRTFVKNIVKKCLEFYDIIFQHTEKVMMLKVIDIQTTKLLMPIKHTVYNVSDVAQSLPI